MCAWVKGEWNAGNLCRTPNCDGRVTVFADDAGVNGAGVNVEICSEDEAEPLGVDQSSGPDDLSDWKSGFCLSDIGKNIDGVCCEQEDAVEVLRHEVGDALADQDDIAFQ